MNGTRISKDKNEEAAEIELEVLGRGNKGLRIEGHENEKNGGKNLEHNSRSITDDLHNNLEVAQGWKKTRK